MQLPISPNLPTKQLARIFDNMSESYKLFWFKAILHRAASGQDTITYGELIDRMIVDAWYMVSEYRLNLGPSDTLEKIVKYVFEISGMKSAEKPETIMEFLKGSQDKTLRTMKRTLALNVPYRLQAPFMPEINAGIWKSRNDTIDYINRQSGMMYTIYYEPGLAAQVHISEDWMDYIRQNLGIIAGWTDYNLICYLQRRNPTVPGISNKIYPPQERKLTAVINYWKGIVERQEVENIYTGEVLSVKDISIDHFVPWSYVASDELWNLTPTTKAVNSSKSNRLPQWETYFDRLCRVEYQAYRLMQEDEQVKRLFARCKKENLNSDEIRYKLYRSDQSIETFGNQLTELILPIYDSARNMGFSEWIWQ